MIQFFCKIGVAGMRYEHPRDFYLPSCIHTLPLSHFSPFSCKFDMASILFGVYPAYCINGG